jgi:hypothetical protein
MTRERAVFDLHSNLPPLDGCPMFAPPAPACRGAYVGRQRRAKPIEGLSFALPPTIPSPLSSREPVTFSIFSCFLHIQPSVFQAPEKAVILSEALRRSIANRGLYGAESKDPGDACRQMLLGAFRPQTTTEDKEVTNSERSRPVPACRGGICSPRTSHGNAEQYPQTKLSSRLPRRAVGSAVSRKPSYVLLVLTGFVSGHDFSRAVKAANDEGFSPCGSCVLVRKVN